jgi:two-component sensor histidine kinase
MAPCHPELSPRDAVLAAKEPDVNGTRTLTETLKLQRAALADFGLYAFQCDDIDDLLNRAAELVSRAMDVQLVKVLEHRPAEGEMLIRGGVNWQPGVVGHETLGDHARSPGGYALRADKPVISTDIEHEHRFETPEVLRRHGVRSMVNVIIAGKGAPYGVLEVDSQEPRDFSDDDIQFLRTYANLLAAAIDRIHTHVELRQSAREQGILARELEHRVRNLLGLVRALATQTSTDNRSAEDYRSAFIGRLQALSTAENLVIEENDERADPLDLAHDVLAPHMLDQPGRIVIDGSPVGLTARQARMFGLALHELATNAAKYGALSVDSGTVHLQWEETTTETDRHVSLTWQEADGPQITPPTRKGFGSRLLEEVVSLELDGRAELVYEPHGLRYHLSFPVGRP